MLGSGRRGSTFVQAALCRTADIWIWGAHDGLLTGLLAWGRKARTSPPLSQASYPFAAAEPEARLAGLPGAEPWMAAWINGFTPEMAEAVGRMAVRRLFADPAGGGDPAARLGYDAAGAATSSGGGPTAPA